MQDQPGINSAERMNHWWYEVQTGRIHDRVLAGFLTFGCEYEGKTEMSQSPKN